MTRRKLFALFVSPIVATALAPTEPQALAAGDEFARLYNAWAVFPRQTGTVDAKEIKLWKEVRKSWKKLDSTITYE